MKISRVITLGLLIPLSGMTVLAVYLNAQPPASELPQQLPDESGAGRPRDRPGALNEIREDRRIKYYPSAPDPKTLQLLSEEQAADQEARSLAAEYAGAQTDEQRAEFKKQLREKLAAIFAMQQKRRAAEIASIEERLAKLKDVSKKRETNKDAIVDRRLEQLTGGVDDLGWEDINRGVRYSAGPGGNVLETVPYRADVLRVPGPIAPDPVEPRARFLPLEKK